MTSLAIKPAISPEDLLRMPDAARFELVDGELVERNVSVLSSLVEGLIHAALSVYVQANQLGWVWPGTLGYQCFSDAPAKVRRPDISFVRAARFSTGYLQVGYLTIPPDLAVEVISPNDTADEIAQKVEEYLAAGVPLVWVVYPEAQIIEIHRKDGTVSKLHAGVEITGEDVLPGFCCKVESIFPQNKAAASQQPPKST